MSGQSGRACLWRDNFAVERVRLWNGRRERRWFVRDAAAVRRESSTEGANRN